MFENALIATELSESPEHLILCKEGLASLGVRRIFAAVCVRLNEVKGLRKNVEALFHTEIGQRKEALERLGYDVKAKLLLGEPSMEVNRWADEMACSLVIVGSRLHSLAREVFIGGAAAELLHHCQKPLLVLRQPQEEEYSDCCPLKSLECVLFATDFSANAEHAFATLLQLVENGLKSVVLMHVQDRSRIDAHLQDRLKEFNAIDENRLERMKETLTSKGAVDVCVELSYGFPKQEILQRSLKGDLSLILMGSQGRGFISEMFLGSVSHTIARRALVPVLLVPALR